MTAESAPNDAAPLTESRLRTPQAAAYAGIVFALLIIVAMLLIQAAVPDDAATDPGWLDDGESGVAIAITLVPFAAIAFLWFIGVLRDLLGAHEDQFFGTVFLGSGLLFLGGVFVWIATIAATLASSNVSPDEFAASPSYVFAASLIKVMGSVVILRMAGVFMFSTAMMWLRTGVVPRWLVIITFVGAVVLLIGGPAMRLVRVSFPVWVLVVSITILVVQRRRSAGSDVAPRP